MDRVRAYVFDMFIETGCIRVGLFVFRIKIRPDTRSTHEGVLIRIPAATPYAHTRPTKAWHGLRWWPGMAAHSVGTRWRRCVALRMRAPSDRKCLRWIRPAIPPLVQLSRWISTFLFHLPLQCNGDHRYFRSSTLIGVSRTDY